MLTLSPQLGEFARAWADEDGIEFDVLLDLGHGVARDYGLAFRLPEDLRVAYKEAMKLDLVRFNGDNSGELAVPATFVIDGDGVVRYASADPDYTVRPEPTEVLECLRTL